MIRRRYREHPIFRLWDTPDTEPPSGFVLEYPGVLRRDAFVSPADQPALSVDLAGTPPVYEEYFEWIDVLEAVAAAEDRFCMAELGAGYGRWLVRAAVALRRLKPEVQPRLIGVEAEPTHFRWMRAHFEDNALDPAPHRLVEAAVDAGEGEAWFTVGRPAEWYGQAIVPEGTTGYELARVRTVGLGTLLDDVELVDLVDVDVQGAELRALGSAIDELDDKVKRVHIATHSNELEAGLRELFSAHGWIKRRDYAIGSTVTTRFGDVSLIDGVQMWVNPALVGTETHRWRRFAGSRPWRWPSSRLRHVMSRRCGSRAPGSG